MVRLIYHNARAPKLSDTHLTFPMVMMLSLEKLCCVVGNGVIGKYGGGEGYG